MIPLMDILYRGFMFTETVAYVLRLYSITNVPLPVLKKLFLAAMNS